MLAKDSLKIEIELFPQCVISHENQNFSQIFSPCWQIESKLEFESSEFEIEFDTKMDFEFEFEF